MVYMDEILQWVIVIVILLFIFSRILKFLLGKKNKQQTNAQNESLKRQTQNRLGRDARAEEQIAEQLKGTTDEKKRKELLRQAGKVAKDEEVAARKGA